MAGWGGGSERRGGLDSSRVATNVDREANSTTVSTPGFAEGLLGSFGAPSGCP